MEKGFGTGWVKTDDPRFVSDGCLDRGVGDRTLLAGGTGGAQISIARQCVWRMAVNRGSRPRG